MASQGERVLGVEIDVMLGEPMVQDTREEDTSLPQGWESGSAMRLAIFIIIIAPLNVVSGCGQGM